jgi:hypothetical protein
VQQFAAQRIYGGQIGRAAGEHQAAGYQQVLLAARQFQDNQAQEFFDAGADNIA